MQIMGDRTFVEVPGDKTHELPPLLVHGAFIETPKDRVIGLANQIIEDEDLIPGTAMDHMIQGHSFEQRRMDLAVQLAEQYHSLLSWWTWGDSIVEWIRQCEITFDTRFELRNLLRPDLWPHAGRTSFVRLLTDKAVEVPGTTLEKSVGLRLTFRQPPPISCFSNQFLFYLNSPVAASAYHSWSELTPAPISSLPPERFRFDVVKM
jgi:hypothetical protein